MRTKCNRISFLKAFFILLHFHLTAQVGFYKKNASLMQRRSRNREVGARGTNEWAIYSPFLVSKILLRTWLDCCQLLFPSAVNKDKIIAFTSPGYQRIENIYTNLIYYCYIPAIITI